jgi:hypothetical protein
MHDAHARLRSTADYAQAAAARRLRVNPLIRLGPHETGASSFDSSHSEKRHGEVSVLFRTEGAAMFSLESIGATALQWLIVFLFP